MSSTGMVLEPPSKPHNYRPHHNNTNSKRKSKHDRSGRKRSKSFSGCGLMMDMKPVPPTKFLLGGNINDPLNLNSLQDEDINRAMNAITPKSSPIPTPPRRKGQIEVIIPPNINDPLNLIGCADDAEYEQQLCSPVKKGRKKRLKKRRTVSASEGDLEARTPETSTDSAKIPVEVVVEKDLSLELSPKKEKSKRKVEEHGGTQAKKFKYSMDKIVSPVVPQPGTWLKRSNHKKRPREKRDTSEAMPQFKEKDRQYQYGNYNRYYGYRNPHSEVDNRLRLFHQHRYLFEGKDILDIGCNVGHVTLSVARDFGAKSVTGIDIDPKLVSIARKNVKYYVKNSDSPKSERVGEVPTNKKSSEFFPISMPILYGPIDIPGFNDGQTGRDFPNNVVFKTCNYILEDDSLLALEQPQFDVILCLSITKWIHLNWGDSGLKQAFRRMYAQLKPGGKLILEPQNWASYKSKRKLTETTFKNYNSIEFFPEKFTEYLLSSVVGFAKSEILGFPYNHSKGFRRPIQIFTKSTMFPSERIEATPNNSITPNNDDPLYQKLLKTERYESQTQPLVEKSEHIYYTNILNRYCGNSEVNCEVNKQIEDDLNKEDLGEKSQSERKDVSGDNT
ncbi:7SK snRNA methylphosphate capping enzyme bin3-like isoform X1 [Tribolium madens]|uniref:7SK snRNA methylphosphate capping enzyme bin3-like isoform X1 n=1 Tax=Tribolium madens TaxID=41895 RepID=UPI001CF72C97|nr:7SK snRNA methylphosphate capping enzyme bin3-like isoform X1 [Tribolium madens]